MESQPTWDEPYRDRSHRAGLTSATVHSHPWRMNSTDFGNPPTFPLLPHFWRNCLPNTGKIAMSFGEDIYDRALRASQSFPKFAQMFMIF